MKHARIEQRSHAPDKRRIAVAAGAALLVALLALAAWWLFGRPFDPLEPDPNARSGTLSAQPADVAPGSYRLVLNQGPVMQAGTTAVPLAFENPRENGYAARLDVTLDATGEAVASTGVVSPGQYLETVSLSRPLDAGQHEATVRVALLEEKNEVSSMTAAITITVQEEDQQ